MPLSDSIEWLSKTNLKKYVEASRRKYDSIEMEFVECLDYVELDLDHFNVYSKKFNDFILKIGPEILTVFELILFNKKIVRFFNDQPELEEQIINIKKKKNEGKEGFMAYLNALPYLKTENAKVKNLNEKITPFKIQKSWLTKKQRYRYWVDWWDYGYNALKHRRIREFKEAATLKHTLFSLAGLWILHERLDRDHGRKGLFRSQVFEIPIGTYVSP